MRVLVETLEANSFQPCRVLQRDWSAWWSKHPAVARRRKHENGTRYHIVVLYVCTLPAFTMVQTKVKPILFSGECYMGNWDMKVGAIDPHHRELQVHMS